MAKVTITESPEYHHLPIEEQIDLSGKTTRQALSMLRGMNFGNLGGMHPVNLSDGTMLSVELQPASDSGSLMSSQRARRFRWARPKPGQRRKKWKRIYRSKTGAAS